MTPRSFSLDELPWPEVQRLLRSDPRLLFAVGALDPHGPHLPVGTAVLIADRVTREASTTTGVLRAPTLGYGVGLPTQKRFPGTAGLRRKTLHRVVNELLANWEDAGIEELIIVTANRYDPHLDALLMALTEEAITTVVDLRSVPVDDIVQRDPRREHAGELETSLALHLCPEQVRREEIVDFVPEPDTLDRQMRGHVPLPRRESRGVVGSPTLATADKGRRLFRRYVDVLVDRVLGSGAAANEPAADG